MPKSKKKHLRPKKLDESNEDKDRDKGGRTLPGKKWRVFNFIVEVAVESPGNTAEEEAAEDAAEFIMAVGRTAGRVHDSYCSITRSDEYGFLRPHDAPVFITDYPNGEKVELTLPRGLAKKEELIRQARAKPKKAKPKAAKAKKSKKKKARF